MINEISIGRMNNLLYKVYLWMTVGLGLTALTSFSVSKSTYLINLFLNNSSLFFVLIICELILVFSLSLMIEKMNFFTALFVYILYSFLNGITLSGIFLIYTQVSIGMTFVIASAMFGFMALYGYFTKSDLSKMGSILLMALFGLIIAMLVNFFLKSPSLYYVISGAGVIIFALLTAYDMQQIKILSQKLVSSGQEINKIGIICALKLYLDFINLFLFLLNFVGKKNNE